MRHRNGHVVAIERPLVDFAPLTGRAIKNEQLARFFVHLHAYLGTACELVFDDDHLVLLRLFSR